MQEKDTQITVDTPRTELDDPINSLLVVINKLVDLESRVDYQSSIIEEIQENLRSIISLLEGLKK